MNDLFERYKNPLPAGVELPEIIIEDRFYNNLGISSDVSNYDFLRNLCYKGVKDRGIDKLENKAEYYERCKYELETLEDLGFTDYILLNWDVLNFCHENGIPTGRARGSAAGSLVLYLINVTDVDPIKYDLFFERFVSKSRAKKIEFEGKTYLDGGLLPDIDNDIDYVQRGRVIEYIESKYPNKTSKILTLNTLSSKICIKEAVKIVGGYSEDYANEVSKSLPMEFNKPLPLKQCYEVSEDFRRWADNHKRIYTTACKLEGLVKNFGVHPSGIAISKKPILDLLPLQYTKDGELISGYDMKYVAEFAVKFDILGLKTVSVLDLASKLAKIDRKSIDVEDLSIYEPAQDLIVSKGLFQIGEKTNLKVCKDVQPCNLQEVSDVVALARPGALQFVPDYVAVKNEEKGVQERHPELDKIILASKGCILFQEQLMQIANRVFGLSLEDAEAIRRACGKKIKQDMEIWEPRIYEQAEKLGIDKDVTDFYWEACIASADYSFNKSHSIAYAMLAAETLFFKFRYPTEFHTSFLNIFYDNHKEIRDIVNELPYFKCKLLPPDINKSDIDFKMEGKDIRYGFKGIKNISEKTFEAITSIRGKSFENKFEMFKALNQSGLNIAAVSNLIRAGILGDKEDRSRLVLEAQVYNILTDREKREFDLIGDKYDYDILNLLPSVHKEEKRGSDGRLLLTDKRFLSTIKTKTEPYKKIFLQNKKYESLSNWFFETSILGYSYSQKLKYVFTDDDAETFIDLDKIDKLPDSSSVKCVGQVQEAFVTVSANGNKYMRITVCDDFATKMFLFGNGRNNKLDNFLENKGELKDGDILILTGSRNGDIVYCDDIRKIDMPVGSKLKSDKK